MASLTPGGWTAIAAWLTVAVVAITLAYAWWQHRHARRRRAQLSQPNVAMFMQHSTTDWHLIELVVKNYGQTPAYGVRFDFANPPTVGHYEREYGEDYVSVTPLNLPAVIPYLAPSQEWRIVWDSAKDRRLLGEAIASRFDGVVTYHDRPPRDDGKPAGRKFRHATVLDWATLPPPERLDVLVGNDRARQEKQRLELLAGILTFFHYASQQGEERALRAEIDLINALTAEVRQRREENRFGSTRDGSGCPAARGEHARGRHRADA
ncbi:hypothetical protein [Mycolicibacterium mageritense]|uniref:Uncharacterized protein n=1 Tax=Mycolicibacterium mageritense TaxID=53462 RepID=A0AAI8XRS1_MYCME|nr:hypothetical protein [Mycolicibacterium mageritense]TXI64210.1 MAG: hypothetical protein E6Q55_06555 [Mycolicibacterium mageritense]BDY32248.1 hypothetical protein hbim_06211 [Mycolicibacterium mageritense]